ncbi:MAG: ORF6N domain-containing protein [Bacteroidales bacterium]|nr:ORF6N domain-containing protein [Bacteroidales bacterium]
MELQRIQNKIYEVRGHKIMLDFDLAELYEVQTKALNQAVKRNIQRFPFDFMFRLTIDEWEFIRSQIATASSNDKNMWSQNVTASQKKRNVSATPYAFTEQGLAMLSGILNSDKAINVNIAIMRAFVMIRQYALTYKELTDKLKEIEGKFTDVYEAINYLLNKDKLQIEQKQRKRIGFNQENQKKINL